MIIQSSIENNPTVPNQYVLLTYIGIFYDKEKAEYVAEKLKEFVNQFENLTLQPVPMDKTK